MGEKAMYIIIETEDGLAIESLQAGMTADEVAARHGAILVDEGPYHSYEDADDALLALEMELFDESEAEQRV
jgi:hypothetical protein